MPSRFHRQIGSPRRDTAKDVQERITRAAIAAQVMREFSEKFGSISGDNAREVLDWQQARTAQLEREAGIGV